MQMARVEKFIPEMVTVSKLKKHPRNYRKHPEDQLDHLRNSIEQHGIYRNVTIANDGTILAGHGVVQAAKKAGVKKIPVIRIDIDPTDLKALKLLAGDNEISNLAEIDDRLLTDMLKEIKECDLEGLIGTGFDEQQLANLAMVTRPQNEIKDFDAAAEWVGMPDYESAEKNIQLVVNLRNDEDKEELLNLLGVKVTEKTKSVWWPPKERDDIKSVEFIEE